MDESVAEKGDTTQLGESEPIVEMTVLFCSIAKYMALSEKMQSQDLVKLLNDHFARVIHSILKHRGLVDKFMGDKVLAYWDANPDATLEACKCALEVLDRSETSQQSTTLERYSVRIGINTGKLSKAIVGTAALKDYTVIGDAVNIAHALQEVGKDYNASILISKSTFDKVHDRVAVREIEDVTIGSRVAPVQIYELVGTKID